MTPRWKSYDCRIMKKIFLGHFELFGPKNGHRKGVKKRPFWDHFGIILADLNQLVIEATKVRNDLQKCVRSLEVEHGAMSRLLFLIMMLKAYVSSFQNGLSDPQTRDGEGYFRREMYEKSHS